MSAGKLAVKFVMDSVTGEEILHQSSKLAATMAHVACHLDTASGD